MSANGQKNRWIFRGIALGLTIAAITGWQFLNSHRPAFDSALPPAIAQISRGERSNLSPEQVYHRAWQIIKEGFYDQKYGGQAWDRWKNRYDGKLKTIDDSYKAIDTMLASLGDPYTRFLNPESFSEENSQIQAKLFGVGMQLGMNKEHKVVVIAPILDTPADRAGMHSGDEITEVDHKPVKGQSLDQVVKQIRGEKGTKVSITYLRNGQRMAAEMVRDEIPIKAVANCEVLPGNIGYIRLDSFISKKAGDEMKLSLKKLSGCKGIILDLRNNPGGLLQNAIDIAKMFINEGTIVSVIDQDGYKQRTLASGTMPGGYKTDSPVVILINQGSASASEILSGALRDNGRAKLVGQKSFGKGLVQAINPLPDGSGINCTIARYLTPNDTDIHKTGIVPEFEVKISDEDFKAGKGPWWIDPTMTNFKRSPTDGKDIQLKKAVEVITKVTSTASNAGNQTVVTQNSTAPHGQESTTGKP